MNGLPGVVQNFQILVPLNRPQSHFAINFISVHVVVRDDIQVSACRLLTESVSMAGTAPYDHIGIRVHLLLQTDQGEGFAPKLLHVHR